MNFLRLGIYGKNSTSLTPTQKVMGTTHTALSMSLLFMFQNAPIQSAQAFVRPKENESRQFKKHRFTYSPLATLHHPRQPSNPILNSCEGEVYGEVRTSLSSQGCLMFEKLSLS